jgi:phosphate transport system substrate-binding protein
MAYAGNSYRTPRVKALALAEKTGSPFVALTRENVANRTYPLSRSAYIYFAPDSLTGDAVKADPKIREFLRYVLSREGQADVAAEGDHFPLTPALAREQLKKLD